MNYILMALGNKPAQEGIGDMLVAFLLAAGTLALIYGVLVLIDRYHRKHGGEEKPAEPQDAAPAAPKSFPEVLSEQIKKSSDDDDKDGIGKV